MDVIKPARNAPVLFTALLGVAWAAGLSPAFAQAAQPDATYTIDVSRQLNAAVVQDDPLTGTLNPGALPSVTIAGSQPSTISNAGVTGGTLGVEAFANGTSQGGSGTCVGNCTPPNVQAFGSVSTIYYFEVQTNPGSPAPATVNIDLSALLSASASVQTGAGGGGSSDATANLYVGVANAPIGLATSYLSVTAQDDCGVLQSDNSLVGCGQQNNDGVDEKMVVNGALVDTFAAAPTTTASETGGGVSGTQTFDNLIPLTVATNEELEVVLTANGFNQVEYQDQADVTNTQFNAVADPLITIAPDQGPDFTLIESANLPSGVPEPATWAMFLLGLGAVGFAMRGSRRKGVAVSA
jgi:hypothetical protein